MDGEPNLGDESSTSGKKSGGSNRDIINHDSSKPKKRKALANELQIILYKELENRNNNITIGDFNNKTEYNKKSYIFFCNRHR